MCGRIEVLLSGMQSTLDNLFEQPLTIQDNLDLRPPIPLRRLVTDKVKSFLASSDGEYSLTGRKN